MLIGISGKKQSGKNTVAKIINILSDWYKNEGKLYGQPDELTFKFLSEKLDIGILEDSWEEHSFAYNLRKCLYTITKDYRVFATDDKTKNSLSTVKSSKGNYYTIRQLLQKFGTEVGRNINPNLWVDSLFNDYNRHVKADSGTHWIITDVRFKNEADAVRNHGGYLIRVNRKSCKFDKHPSEIALDNYNKFDSVINNDGTLVELFSKVNEFLVKNNLVK